MTFRLLIFYIEYECTEIKNKVCTSLRKFFQLFWWQRNNFENLFKETLLNSQNIISLLIVDTSLRSG